ncbi:hypothetical protein Tco_0494338, partial [Tanacetum coccineum]
MVSKTFDIRLMGASSKSCEYVLSTLMQVFEDKRFAHAVKKRTLDNLITEILLWLLNERVPRMHDGSQLLKVLNVLMLRILDNAERTSSFVVLISLLIPLDPSRWPSPPSNESFATRNRKFSNLVVKCLIKLTKDLQSTIDEVDLDHILQIIHVYLQELGIDEIRRSKLIEWEQEKMTYICSKLFYMSFESFVAPKLRRSDWKLRTMKGCLCIFASPNINCKKNEDIEIWVMRKYN